MSGVRLTTGRRRRWSTALVATALVLTACGNDNDDGADGRTEDAVVDRQPTADDAPVPPDAEDDGLPGERLDIYPYEGDPLVVVGIEADDTIDVHRGPGEDVDVVHELGATTTGITATGHNRVLDDDSIWVELSSGDDTGWARSSFLLQPGPPEDITAEIVPDPDDRPRTETLVDLADEVVDLRRDEWSAPDPAVVVVDGPVVDADEGEITVDMLGLGPGEDAVGGERLHVRAGTEPGGEGFALDRVEATVLCLRGVTDDGLCL